MSAISRILILTHRNDRFSQIQYMLREIATFWRQAGILVDVQVGLPVEKSYDIAILHVDLTETPEEYLEAVRCFPIVINGKVRDISKKAISRNIVQQGDGYDGPVIVKTNRNCGGLMEGLQTRKRGGTAKFLHKVRQRLPWQFRSQLGSYPIFEEVSHLPGIVWNNRNLVVERFQPERSGDFYCLRSWVFFGDRESNSISYSKGPVIKSHNVIRRESGPEIPTELRSIRKQMAFDFGKFDYALLNGKVVLYDVNRTPTLGASHEQVVKNMSILAEGIQAFR